MNILKDFFNYGVIKGFSSKEKLIPHLKYTQWKKALLEKILKCYPCSEELNAFIAAQTEEATWQVVLRNMRWLAELSIDPGPIPPEITHCGGWLYLTGYKHPLPKGFTHCGESLFLGGYKHPLPEGFTHCDGSLYLNGYKHPLPKGFTHCGGSLYLNGYKHPLPKGFTHCGGWIDLFGYNHPLPEGFKENQNDL